MQGRDYRHQAYGYCECGCGEPTSLAKQTDTQRGYIKGEPVRFRPGHQGRRYFGPEYIEDAATGCWEWQHRRYGGYGRVNGRNGSRMAHLVYYERLVGPVPAGLQLDHLCQNPGCVNPKHLEPVTPAVNSHRGRSTKLTGAQVAAIRASTLPSRVIAPEYGVHHVTICAIRRRASWASAEAA